MCQKQICVGQECDITKLDEFVGHSVVVYEKEMRMSFIYNQFNYDIDCDGNLVLVDENVDTGDCKTYITMDEIELVKNIDNEDMYRDVISIEYDSNQLNICCAEKKPIIPKCDRCKKELDEYSHPWIVNQQAGFTSERDGDYITLQVCNTCFEEMFGSVIPESEEVGEWGDINV